MSHGHDSSQHGAQNVSRRRFLGAAATAAAGTGLAIGASGTAAAATTYPRVTTRGHYDITWYGSVYLTDGHTEWDYDTAGDIPGLDSAAPDELLVHVHGWMNEP